MSTFAHADEQTKLSNGLLLCQEIPRARTHSRRAVTENILFSFKATTVARPLAVSPMIWVASGLHLKCRDHFCRRGLKRRTVRFVTGSCACVCGPLKLLHERQESQRFPSSSPPPRTAGRMCSISNSHGSNRWGLRQYPQRSPAIAWMRSRTSAGTRFPVTASEALAIRDGLLHRTPEPSAPDTRDTPASARRVHCAPLP